MNSILEYTPQRELKEYVCGVYLTSEEKIYLTIDGQELNQLVNL